MHTASLVRRLKSGVRMHTMHETILHMKNVFSDCSLSTVVFSQVSLQPRSTGSAATDHVELESVEATILSFAVTLPHSLLCSMPRLDCSPALKSMSSITIQQLRHPGRACKAKLHAQNTMHYIVKMHGTPLS